jgi:hypothetical protein
MSRRPSIRRHLAVLALLAALLAALAPTVSRTLAATAAKGTPILMEMCTMAGIQLIDVSPFLGASDGDPAPSPPPAAPMAPACDYCVLATPLLVVLALLLAALAWRPAPPADRRYALAQRPLRNLRGLGSQAPPVLS